MLNSEAKTAAKQNLADISARFVFQSYDPLEILIRFL